MASEETPLLSESTDNSPDRLDDVYLRFSSTKKNIILVMVSGCGVINCMFISGWFESACRSTGTSYTMSRFYDWDVYTFNTTDCKGPGFNRSGRQVNPYIKREDHLIISVFSIAISTTVFAASFGGLVVASYSTFCKFVASNRLHD